MSGRFGFLHWAGTCLVGAFLTACGTEPSPDVTGPWSLSTSYAGGDFACTVLATLTFVGSRPSWSGTLAEEQVDCTSAGTPLTIAPDTLDVIVTLDGGTISFSPLSREGASGCADFNFEGRVRDDQMFGTVKTTPVFCQGTYVEMRGTWQAQRESP